MQLTARSQKRPVLPGQASLRENLATAAARCPGVCSQCCGRAPVRATFGNTTHTSNRPLPCHPPAAGSFGRAETGSIPDGFPPTRPSQSYPVNRAAPWNGGFGRRTTGFGKPTGRSCAIPGAMVRQAHRRRPSGRTVGQHDAWQPRGRGTQLAVQTAAGFAYQCS
jgi:hypothetical protein